MGRGQLITKEIKTHAARRQTPDEFGETTLKLHLRFIVDRAADLLVSIKPEMPLLTYELVRPIPPHTVTHYVMRIAERVGVDTHLHALPEQDRDAASFLGWALTPGESA
jgi:hypothetical protein